jgi:prevent-host-death family protein
MSSKAGIRELRQQASSVLRRVVGGEVIEVTSHGHPIARIVPLRSSALEQLVLEGRTDAGPRRIGRVARHAARPYPLWTDGTRALEELRSDERQDCLPRHF